MMLDISGERGGEVDKGGSLVPVSNRAVIRSEIERKKCDVERFFRNRSIRCSCVRES